MAERLHSLVRGALPWPGIDVEKALPWVEKKTGKMLAASQRAAIEMALRSKAMVITGGPGVGKTTLLDAILRILAAKGTKILLAAPKAAGHGIDFQQAVDGLRLDAGLFGHAFRRASGRRGE